MRAKCNYHNNMVLIHGFILVTILATAKSAEAEITMEAAFQGHCGHTSPCEQLCYEIHDGMYECDCIEGYELNKNGYSCQVINSTNSGDGHSKSDEDVLYQKGASFSAKLAANNNKNNVNIKSNNQDYNINNDNYNYNIVNNGNEDDEDNDVNNFNNEIVEDNQVVIDDNYNETEDENIADGDRNDDGNNQVNLNDYYISAESISFSNEEDQYHQLYNNSQDDVSKSISLSGKISSNTIASQTAITTKSPLTILTKSTMTINNFPSTKLKSMNRKMSKTNQLKVKIKKLSMDGTEPSRKTIEKSSVKMDIYNANNINNNNNNNDNNNNMEDDYYMKQDMSIYDDVNNNQLNLKPLNHDTYQESNTNNSTIRNTTKRQNINFNTNTYRNLIRKPCTLSYSNENQDCIEHSTAYPTDTAKTSITHKSIEQQNVSTSNELGNACHLACGLDGFCERDTIGMARCLCPFGKMGINCAEHNDIRVPKFSKNSWLAFAALRGAYKHVQIRLEFRPESFDGIILLSGERDDLTGDFMALLLNKGFVEFWFDCGSGVGTVRSRETILLNEWNSVIIYRHRWDAWLILNHGNKVQGRSNGLFSRITFREPVFLGGIGNITGLAKRLPVYSGFIGCIRRFVANEHDYKFSEYPKGDVINGFDIQECVSDRCVKFPCQHGGKCLPSDKGAVCLCPIGFVGDLCEIRMDLQIPAFNGSSYLRYAPLGEKALIWLELKIILKPEQQDGIILYSGPNSKRGDFIVLSLNNGYVEFTFDLGSGPAVVRSDYALTIGQWHTIKVSRTARLAVLKINDFPEVMTISSNGFWHLSLPENLFLGGINHVDKLPLYFKTNSFFTGCIQKIDINGHSLAIISEALGGTNIENCPHACLARPCGQFSDCLPQMENYECRCSVFNVHCNKALSVPNAGVPSNSAIINTNAPVKTRSEHSFEMMEAKMIDNKSYKINENNDNITMNTSHSLSKVKKSKSFANHYLNNENHKKTQVHKPQEQHQKQQQSQYLHQISKTYLTPIKDVYKTLSSNTVSTMKTPTSSQHEINTSAQNNDDEEDKDIDEDEYEDDIIFREILEKHKEKEKEDKTTTQSKTEIFQIYDSLSKNGDININRQKEESVATIKENHELVNGRYNKKQHPHISQHQRKMQQQSEYGVKHVPYDKSSLINAHGKYIRKLSRLPTHYESFQTNPDSDILTFDDNIELMVSKEYEPKPLEYAENYDDNYASLNKGDTIDSFALNDQPLPAEPIDFIVDEKTLFDEQDDAEEYHRKQLTEDMKRIMANNGVDKHGHSIIKTTLRPIPIKPTLTDATSIPAKYPQLTVDIYDYEDGEEDVEEELPQDTENNNNNVIPEVMYTTTSLNEHTTTQQTPHTDWSLLKKFELSSEHQSQIDVHKNFGACFSGEDSYFHYNDADTMRKIISYKVDLNLRIKTHSKNGIILWTGRQGTTEEHDDYLSLGIENGYLHFRYDLGSGEVDILFNMTKISDGLWHRVRAIRDSQIGYLEVDGRKSITQRSPGKLKQLNTDTGLYVGGMPDVNYFTHRKYESGIVGCISEIVLAGELKLNFDPNTLGTAHNVETGIL